MFRYLLSLILLIAVLIGQIVAFHNPILLRLPVFHLIMHIAGGVGVGLLCLALVRSFALPRVQSRYIILMGVLIVGLLWELFETIFNLTGYRIGTAHYYVDTLKDLVNDLVGGLIVLWTSRK